MKGKNLLSYVVPSLRPNQRCEACGEEFHCDASLAGCWCSEVKLTDAARADLRAKYRGCLCRSCLEKAAELGRSHLE